ncbi:MAG: hypothetical protein WA463_08125 [Terriglobales bacterium]
MKLGAENRTKVIILGVLLLIAAISVIRMFDVFGSSAPAASPGRTAAAPPPRQAPNRGAAIADAGPRLDPELDLKRLESSEGMKYEGTGRNIFVPAMEEIPKPVELGLKTKPEPPPGPPPPPQPPPINLKFFGFASHAGEPKQVFLAQGDTVFIGREGEIVDRRYKIVRINPNSVEIEDVLNNNRQTIPLTPS